MGKLADAVNKYDPAFPLQVEHEGAKVNWWGMSQRDYFAAAALTGLLMRNTPLSPGVCAELAYKNADAMIAAGKAGP